MDPLARLRRYVEARHGWTEEKERALEAEIDAEVKNAVATAEKTDAPSLESMFDDVFATLPWHLEEQREELLKGPRAKGHGH